MKLSSDNLYLIIGAAIILLSGFYYYQKVKPKEVLIDSFEGKMGRDTVDFGAAPGSGIRVNSSKHSKCGMHSLQMDYDLKLSGYAYCARGYDLNHTRDSSIWGAGKSGWLIEPDEIDWTEFEALTVYLRGNKNGKVAIDIKDDGNELWRFMVDVDFSGWRKIVMPFDDFMAREDWQPETARKDFILDFPIKSFQFEPKKPGLGTLNFDCMRAVVQY